MRVPTIHKQAQERIKAQASAEIAAAERAIQHYSSGRSTWTESSWLSKLAHCRSEYANGRHEQARDEARKLNALISVEDHRRYNEAIERMRAVVPS